MDRDASTNAHAMASELEHSEARTALILQTALDAVVAIDSRGLIIDWNRQAETIFGWSKAEVLGKKLSSTIVPPQYRQSHDDGMRRFLATGEARVLGKRLELTAMHRDGHEFPVELAIAPPAKIKGEFVFSAFIRDITERKRAELALQQAHEQSHQQNQLLEAALTEARVAVRAKSAFLATMSHEIRTPMHGIISMVGFLMTTALDSEQREYAETIQQCSESLLQIINDILDFSKMDAGKLSLDRVSFNLRQLVEDVLQLFVLKAEDKQLELGCLVTASAPRMVVGDPGRFRQVLVNLVGNAVKFTESGEVTVHVTRLAESGEHVTVRIAVTDTGPGIDADLQKTLFQPFTQGDSSTTRKHGGTGLGLAISKQLVQLMGGDIGIESVPGQGATFWFTAVLGKPAQVGAPEPVMVPLRGRRICIVDDNQTNRRILENHCRTWGAEHLSAASAEEGLRAIRAAHVTGQPFDVAVIDMQMPKMDGLQLARELQREPHVLNATRLVLLTSVGMRGDAERAQGLSFSAYLVKPIRESQLAECLATVLGQPRIVPDRQAAPRLVTRHTLREQSPRQEAWVLVAEDNEINQKVAVRMLKELGYQVDVVRGGEEAIEAVRRKTYCAILMDCRMPGTDGYAATAAIRSREPAGTRIPIIAMTADAMPEDRQKCLAAGMDDYVAKPVMLETLQSVLDRWIHRVSASADGAVERHEGGDACVDPTVLQELRLLDGELVATLITHFLEDVPRQLKEMQAALMGGNLGHVAELAHSLKGSCANLGVRQLGSLARDLQRCGETNDSAAAAELLNQMSRVLPSVQRRLAGEREASNASRG